MQRDGERPATSGALIGGIAALLMSALPGCGGDAMTPGTDLGHAEQGSPDQGPADAALPDLQICPPSMTGIPCDDSVVCRVSPTGTPAGDGSDWAAQARDLQGALDDVGCDELWLAAGVYRPVDPADALDVTDAERAMSITVRREVRVYGGFDGTEVARMERDPAANATILSGDIDANDVVDSQGATATTADVAGRNSLHVVWLDGTADSGAALTRDTVLDGITITGGHADGIIARSLMGYGGGLFCDGEAGVCSPTLRDVLFVGNAASYSGGAFYGRAVDGESSPTLERVRLRDNTAGQSGGAMYFDARRGTSESSLTDVAFEGNVAGVSGGAIYELAHDGVASPALRNVTFSDNRADEDGGAMLSLGARGTASPTLVNVTFAGNAGRDGGAMLNVARGEGVSSPALSYVTFSQNTASRAGGAIASSAQTDGVSAPTLTGVILWGDSAGVSDAEISSEMATPILRSSVVEGGCPPASSCEASVRDADPRLGPLQDNGGFTLTMAPAASGAAVDGVDANDAGSCPANDQRGVSRPQGAACEIGAVEVTP